MKGKNCDYKQVIVSNPDGYDLTIQEVIKSTNDPKILVTALENPNITEGTFDCIISKLMLMAVQGYAKDAVVTKVLTAALEIPVLSKEGLKSIEDSLLSMSEKGYISYSVVANISIMIETKKAELSTIGR